MQARGPLMIAHRLIERMIAVIEHRLKLAERTHSIDPSHSEKEDKIFFPASRQYFSEPISLFAKSSGVKSR